MVFNDTTNKNGLIQECETWLFGSDYGAISGNSSMLLTFTRLLNYGLDVTVGEILKTDGKWQYDDSNNTDLPIATTTLTAGLQNYTLDLSHLKIHGVDVLDSEGNYQPLKQIDYREIRQTRQSDTEFFETDGMPIYYDVVGDQLKLYPAPSADDVTTTAGLRVVFQRQPDYFSSTDTSVEVGIPRMFHDLPALFACNKYAKANSLGDKARELDNELAIRKQDIKNFFSKRNVDRKKTIRPAYRSSR